MEFKRYQTIDEISKRSNEIVDILNSNDKYNKLTAAERDDLEQEVRDLADQRKRIERAATAEKINSGELESRQIPKGGAYSVAESRIIQGFGYGEEQRFMQHIMSKNQLPDGIQARDLSLEKAIGAMVTGDWKGCDLEKRVMATSPNASGGFLVPEAMAAGVIGKAINAMRVTQAGARVVPMTSKTMTMARVDGIPTGAWLAENATGSFEDITFGAVELTAKKLMVLTSMSLELFEDGIQTPGVIEQALADAIALEWDRVALIGSGIGAEPTGISNAANTLEEAHNAALTNYAAFSSAYYKLQAANEEASALIMHPRSFGELDVLAAIADGQYLRPPASFENFKKLPSAQIPITLGGGTDTLAIMGDFSQLVLGMRTNLHIEMSRDADDAFKKGQVQLRAYMRGDIGLARPAAFCKITGIAAT